MDLINTRDRLLAFLDQEMSDSLSYHFWNSGVVIRHNEEYEKIEGCETIDKAPGDDEILKNTVDFVSFSYYASRCASAEMNANNSSAANVVKSLRNPYLQVSDWGWGIDPLGLSGCNRKSTDADGSGTERFTADRCCFFRCGVWSVHSADLPDAGCCGTDG